MNSISVHRQPPQDFLDHVGRRAEVFFDREIASWVVLDPKKSLELVRGRHLAVPVIAKDLGKAAERIGRPLPDLIFAAHHIPLVLEGPAHTKARRGIAALFSACRPTASAELPGLVDRHLFPLQTAGEFELMATIVNPLLDDVFARIFDMSLAEIDGRFQGTKIFDRFMSRAAAIKADEHLRSARCAASKTSIGDEGEDAIGLKLATYVLGRDSLAGTLGASLVGVFSGNAGKRLDEIVYPDLPADSGVPFAERVALDDFAVDNASIAKGDRVRLYFRAFAFAETSADQVHMFGAGSHSCLGRQFSVELWKCMTKRLSRISGRVTLVGYEMAEDNVFVLPDHINVRISS